MESWRKVWRDGVVPLVSSSGLRSLYEVLIRDDPRLIQGATTKPPPLACVGSWPVEASDALTYLFWRGEDGATVGEAEEVFAQLNFNVDGLLGEPGACRWFLLWYDEVDRKTMLRELLPEVERAMELSKGREHEATAT